MAPAAAIDAMESKESANFTACIGKLSVNDQ